MSGNLRIIAAILRKDLAVLWPLAVIVVLLPVLRSDAVLQNLRNDNLRAGTIGISVLATMLLIVSVMHQDASASLTGSWGDTPRCGKTCSAIRLNTGAATTPPQASAFGSSTTTTMAKRGSSAGA